MIRCTQPCASAILAVVAFVTDASSVLHAQQCPPGRNVIIDPGLVPRRPRITPQAIFAAESIVMRPVVQTGLSSYRRAFPRPAMIAIGLGSCEIVSDPSFKSDRDRCLHLTALQGKVAGADQMAHLAVAQRPLPRVNGLLFCWTVAAIGTRCLQFVNALTL
jgi:hypothetical protein